VTYIFVSYASADREFVARLIPDLQNANITVWIDQLNLKTGTPDWEQALRSAISQASAVLLIATPQSLKSQPVSAELAIARMYNVPVYPVWADGQHWVEAITMDRFKSQYIDARGEKYSAGLAAIIATVGGQGITPAIIETVIPPTAVEVPIFNPYKGLRAFTEQDSALFFGRERFVTQLVDKLDETLRNNSPRLLAVIGASGSGKSSVLMAGLLPKLRGGAIADSNQWHYLPALVPGAHPLESLSDALAAVLPNVSMTAIDEDLRNPNGRGLHRLAGRIGGEQRVVLYIDQFEELFTQTTDEAERAQFISLLTTAITEPDGKLIVLLTLRADFYDRPLNYPELGALMDAHSVSILPMALAEVFDAVQKPATAAGLTFDEGLAADLVFEVREQPGSLPLLQFALDQLYKGRTDRHLTRSAYGAIGGVRGALAKHAEAVYAGLPSDADRTLARALFLRLIEPGATEQDTVRRRAERAELTLADSSQTERLRTVADTFVDERLLVTNRTGDVETLEVAHEALIREWERLGSWLHEAREDVLLQKKISADTLSWVKDNRQADYGALYSGRVLREALQWAEQNLPSADEAAFFRAGTEREAQMEALELSRKRELVKAAERAEASRRASVAAANRARLILLALIASVILAAVTLFLANAQYVADLEQANATLTLVGEQVLSANAALTPIPITLAAANAQVTDAAALVATSGAEATYASALVNEVVNDTNRQLDAAATARIGAENAAADAGTLVANATATLGAVQAQGTEVAAQATYFGIEQARIGTLSAGAVVIPPGTLTPELLLPTLTGIAQLRQWEPRIIVEEIQGVEIEMVEVPSGCFMMGSVAGGDEGPVHEQCFTEPFYIDRYEVTQAQFAGLEGEMAEDFAFPGEDRPVENINWFEARDFCLARDARLPTEREWEYAARGPDSLTYPWGNTFVPENVVYNRVESQGTADVVDADGNPARPGGASWVGALDMSGNVMEWTSTRYDDLDFSQSTLNYQGLFLYPYRENDGREADETRAAFDQRVEEQSFYTLRVVRGFSWANADSDLRGAARFGGFADFDVNIYGFRCARSS